MSFSSSRLFATLFAAVVILVSNLHFSAAQTGCNQDPPVCDRIAFCEEIAGSPVCTCPPGSFGDGYTCSTSAWTLRTVFKLPGDQIDAWNANWDTAKALYCNFVDTGSEIQTQNSIEMAKVADKALEYDPIEDATLITVNAFFGTEADCRAADLLMTENTVSALMAKYDAELGLTGTFEVVDSPSPYAWVLGSSSDPFMIRASGFRVENVYFDPAGCTAGCWVVEIVYTRGARDAVNVFYMPRVEDLPENLGFVESTYLPYNFPCNSDMYNPADETTYDKVTACCLPEFLTNYRVNTEFAEWVDGSQHIANNCTGTGKPISSRSPPSGIVRSTSDAIGGILAGVNESYIVNTGAVNKYANVYSARVHLDEIELREHMALLEGEVGVQYRLDTFVGIAQFSPTSNYFLDSFATQTRIRMERTSFMTVAVHGVNDLTFVEATNVRLHQIWGYSPDDVKSQYIAVTFTVPDGYQADPITGLIPEDSVRVGQAGRYSQVPWEYGCRDTYYGADSTVYDTFAEQLQRDCAPFNMELCEPHAIEDRFQSFNVPLGLDFFDNAGANGREFIFLEFVVSMVAPNGVPTETVVSVQVPLTVGGVINWCVKEEAEVVNECGAVDLMLGTAITAEEMPRLRVFENMLTDGNSSGTLDSDSIESGLATLVIKGDHECFCGSRSDDFSFELEDLITVHIMEGDDATKYNQVLGLMASQQAFSVTIDTVNQRAVMDPSPQLLAICPARPQPPTLDDMFPSTCVVRRDMRRRTPLVQAGGVATLMELSVTNASYVPEVSDLSDEVRFLESIFGESDYVPRLTKAFVPLINQKWDLNGRFRRAWWINPGYEWAPSEWNADSYFHLSQRIIMTALFNLEEDGASAAPYIEPSRRSVGWMVTTKDAEGRVVLRGKVVPEGLSAAAAAASKAEAAAPTHPQRTLKSAQPVGRSAPARRAKAARKGAEEFMEMLLEQNLPVADPIGDLSAAAPRNQSAFSFPVEHEELRAADADADAAATEVLRSFAHGGVESSAAEEEEEEEVAVRASELCLANSWAPTSALSIDECVCEAGYTGAGGSEPCTPCGAGSFKFARGPDACSQCPEDTYSDAEGATSCAACPAWSEGPAGSTSSGACQCVYGALAVGGECVPCPAGSYAAFEGSATCAVCPPNTYSAEEGATAETVACLPCWGGSVADAGSASCLCEAGFYADAAASCAPCPLDEYATGLGNDACAACPVGAGTGAVGATVVGECTCKDGFFGPAGQDCAECPAGSFCSEGQEYSCPAFASSPAGSAAASDCVCGAGYFGANGDACSECPPNAYCEGGEAAVGCPFFPNQKAPAGSDALGDCVCEPGYHGSGGTCAICPAGSFCPGAEVVSACPDMATSEEGAVQGSDCYCPDGYVGPQGSACSPCPAGSWCAVGVEQPCPSFRTSPALSSSLDDCLCIDGYEAIGDYLCIPCHDGVWCAAGAVNPCQSDSTSPALSTSQDACTCNAGFYPDGAASCAACAAGSYKDAAGDGTCTLCAAGKYLEGSGAAHESSCRTCPPYTDSLAGSGSLADCVCSVGYEAGANGCVPCTPGFYAADANMPSCQACPAGTFAEDSGASSCADCPAKSSSEPGAAICDCAPGYSYDQASHTCNACPAGTFKDTVGTAECTQCPEGTWSDATAVETVEGCNACPANSEAPAGSTAETACECSKGFSPAGGVCAPCAAGSYKDTVGADACAACPANSLSPQGADEVADCACNAGYAGSAPNCVACGVGTEKPLPGPGSCSVCPAGSYADAEGSPACTACPAFTDSPEASDQLSDCICVAGADGPDGGPCTQCSPGTYKPMAGSAACVQCVEHTYLTESGSQTHTDCLACPANMGSDSGSDALGDCACNAGYEPDGAGGCAPCALNFYKEGRGDGSCAACPHQQQTFADATVALDQCYCEPGWYGENGADCLPCPAHYFCYGGKINPCPYFSGSEPMSWSVDQCDCEPGYFHEGSAAGSVDPCIECPPDQICNYNISFTPVPCPAGTKAAPGARYYEDCVCIDGYIRAEGDYGPCNPNPDPTKNPNTPEPLCPEGAEVPPGVTDPSMCQCREGFVGDWAWDPSCGDAGCFVLACSACPQNSFCTGGTHSEVCPLNSFCPEHGTGPEDCLCDCGYYTLDPLEVECIPCPEDSYCSASRVNQCPENSHAPAGSCQPEQCVCDDGYEGLPGETCTPCEADVFCKNGIKYPCAENSQSDPLSSDQLDCKCNKGYEGEDGGPCFACPVGHFKLEVGDFECTPAENNTYCWLQGAGDKRACADCPANEMTLTDGRWELPQCVCEKGYYGPDGAQFGCSPCEGGQYKDTTGSAECSVCAADTYQPLFAATDEERCLGCPALTTSVEESDGRNDCQCVPGYTGPDGSESCLACVAGTYKNAPGSASCALCPVDTFSTLLSATDVSDCGGCPATTTSAKGSDELTDCVCRKGYTGPDGAECDACAAGLYKDVIGSAACAVCPPDSTSLAAADELRDCQCNAGFGGSGPAGCAVCAVGKYKDEWASRACTSCPVGTYNPLTGSDSLDACVSCPDYSTSRRGSGAITDCLCDAGATGPDGGECVQCALGTYKSEVGDSQCISCPAGTYSDVLGTTSQADCSACPANEFSDPGAASVSECTCNSGYTRDGSSGACVPCEVNLYKDFQGDGACGVCPTYSGTWAPGQSTIDGCYCAPGYFGPTGGPCEECPPGSYCNGGNEFFCPENSNSLAGSDAPEDCECVSGFYGEDGGLCRECKPGQYCPGGGETLECPDYPEQSSVLGSDEVQDCVCEPGFFGPDGGLCDECPANSYCPGGTTPTPCPDLTVSDPGATAEVSCICQPGYYGEPGGPCTECEAGSWCDKGQKNTCPGNSDSPAGSDEQTDCVCVGGYKGAAGAACTPCKEGTFCDEGEETACPAGSSSPAISDELSDCVCDPGYTGPDGGPCAPCAAGSYKEAAGSAACVPCDAGLYSDVVGLADGSKCLQCPANSDSPAGSAKTGCICNMGYTGPDGGSCSACPSDTYKDVAGSDACASCPLNAVTLQTASVDLLQCTCDKGYTGVDGAACSSCPAGSFKNTFGEADCTTCPVGTYQENEAQTSCPKCQAHTYNGNEGSTTQADCLSCPFATSTQGKGHDEIVDCKCNKGYTGPDGEACTACEVGNYKPTWGSAPCTDCEAGKYQELEAQTVCTNCPADTWSDTVEAASADTCTACPTHMSTDGDGKAVATDCKCNAGYTGPDGVYPSCTACPLGEAKGTWGDAPCDVCAEGSYSDELAQTECDLCAPGKYQPTTSATAEEFCLTCPENSTSLEWGSGPITECICNAGHTGPDGTACPACIAGTYKPLMGSGECTECGRGKYSTETAQTDSATCTNCDAGKYNSVFGAYEEAFCLECPENSNTWPGNNALSDRPQKGRKWLSNCKCNKGYFGEDGEACTACEVGTYKEVTSDSECLSCAVDTYADAVATVTCTGCPMNTFSPERSDNITDCICNAGYTGRDGEPLGCTACFGGTYKDAVGSSECVDCGAGTYQELTASTHCDTCETDTFSTAVGSDTAATCDACPANTQSAIGSDDVTRCVCNAGFEGVDGEACSACPAGKIKDYVGEGTCVDCPEGEFAPQEALTACSQCDAGSYTPEAGLSACLLCAAGSYNTETGLSACVECLAGEYNGVDGLTTCFDCGAGTFSAVAGESACTDCPAGEFVATGGSTTCFECDAGKFTGTEGLTACADCAAGSYQELEGQSACEACAAESWVEAEGSTRRADCSCNAGFTGPDGEPCVGCAAGKYKTAPGSQQCTDCGLGTFSEALAQTSADTCSNCPADTFQPNLGVSDPLEGCLACPSDSESPAGSTAIADCVCSAGFSGIAAVGCEPCAAGSFKGGAGTAECEQCPADSYADTTGLSSCTSCPANSATPEGSTHDSLSECICAAGYEGVDCTPCAAGTYKSELGSGSCVPCEAGTYADALGQATCEACPAGTFSTTPGATQQSLCTACPALSTSAPGSDDPADCVCDAGYFGLSCEPCAAGSYKDALGTQSCDPCPAGTYGAQQALSECTACAAGKFSDAVGASSPEVCTTCPQGTELAPGALGGSREDCICKAGSFGPPGGPCTTCPAGTYAESAGSLACTACPKGTYSEATGQTSDGTCALCPADTYGPTEGAFALAECQACPANSEAAEGSEALLDCACAEGYVGNPAKVCVDQYQYAICVGYGQYVDIFGEEEQAPARRSQAVAARRPESEGARRALPDQGNGVAAAEVLFGTDIVAFMVNTLQMPAERLLIWHLELDLDDVRACLDDPELRRMIRSIFTNHLQPAGNMVELMQLTTMTADRSRVVCGRRSANSVAVRRAGGGRASLEMVTVLRPEQMSYAGVQGVMSLLLMKQTVNEMAIRYHPPSMDRSWFVFSEQAAKDSFADGSGTFIDPGSINGGAGGAGPGVDAQGAGNAGSSSSSSVYMMTAVAALVLAVALFVGYRRWKCKAAAANPTGVAIVDRVSSLGRLASVKIMRVASGMAHPAPGETAVRMEDVKQEKIDSARNLLGDEDNEDKQRADAESNRKLKDALVYI